MLHRLPAAGVRSSRGLHPGNWELGNCPAGLLHYKEGRLLPRRSVFLFTLLAQTPAGLGAYHAHGYRYQGKLEVPVVLKFSDYCFVLLLFDYVYVFGRKKLNNENLIFIRRIWKTSLHKMQIYMIMFFYNEGGRLFTWNWEQLIPFCLHLVLVWVFWSTLCGICRKGLF